MDVSNRLLEFEAQGSYLNWKNDLGVISIEKFLQGQI